MYSFCRILLPRDQREYYNDRINFKNEHDLNLSEAATLPPLFGNTFI